jgi:hypothetical protein
MDFKEKFDILSQFNEGCELTYCVKTLLEAASTLNEINMPSMAYRIIGMVEDIIGDYIECLMETSTEEAYQKYLEIPESVYRIIYGNKMSKGEFFSLD